MPPPPNFKEVTVQFTRLEVKDDQDGFFDGDGEIYFRYRILNGDVPVFEGTLPGVMPNGQPLTWSLGDGDATNDLGAGPHARFSTNTSSISIQVQVFEDDDFLTGDIDHLNGDLAVAFNRTENYGAGPHVHDTNDYKLFYTVTAVDINP